MTHGRRFDGFTMATGLRVSMTNVSWAIVAACGILLAVSAHNRGRAGVYFPTNFRPNSTFVPQTRTLVIVHAAHRGRPPWPSTVAAHRGRERYEIDD